MAVLLPTNLVFFRSKYKVVRSDKDGNMGRLRDVSPSQGLLQSAIRSPWEGETSLNLPIFPSLSDVLKQVFPLLNLKVVRLWTWPPMQWNDCLRATDRVPTGSVTQRSNNERLFNIGVAPPVSSTQWTGAAGQCREISPDKHNQHAQKPLGTATNSAIAQASNHRERERAYRARFQPRTFQNDSKCKSNDSNSKLGWPSAFS